MPQKGVWREFNDTDCEPGDVLETKDIVCTHLPMSRQFFSDVILTTRNADGYYPPAPILKLTVLTIVPFGEGTIPVVFFDGAVYMLLLMAGNSFRKI